MSNVIFVCGRCDAQASKWAGRCEGCGAWGTVAEQSSGPVKSEKGTMRKAAPTRLFSDIQPNSIPRAPTGLQEVDRVLGGGIVPGSLILLGGEPGIGKSTLILQIAGAFPNALYCSGEESAEQIKMRMDRMNIDGARIAYAGTTDIDAIIATILKEKPGLAIIDSIQTMTTDDAQSEAGSVTQVRAVTVRLLETAKNSGVPILLVGHVTKDGAVAGPKTLEHLVDTVLYLEGERSHLFRLLRSVKNRFGGVDEVGVFEMRTTGLMPVDDPARAFLDERTTPIAGAATTVMLEGNRPFFLEVQALVTKTAFGFPQRRAEGFDTNRLQMLIAVLMRRAGLALGQSDVFVNIAGGLKVREPAADLAVALAIASAQKNVSLPERSIVFGEVGLTGELRRTARDEKRRDAASRLGYTTIIAPPEYKTVKEAIALL